MKGRSTVRARFAITGTKFAVAWVMVDLLRRLNGAADRIHGFVHGVLDDALAAFPTLHGYAVDLFGGTVNVLWRGGGRLLFWATILAVLGALVRMVARARVRARQSDFLDRLRIATANAKTLSTVCVLPGASWAMLEQWPGPWSREHPSQWLHSAICSAPAIALMVWISFALLKKGSRELLAPTMRDGADVDRSEIGSDEIAFDAVALTPQSIALVIAFTVIMVAVPTFFWTRTVTELLREGGLFYLFVGYIAFAITGALAFRRASRVSIGVDGIHVRGTSRARFVGYRDIDLARVNGATLELVRGKRVVLRLQLHGRDAARRDAILARVAENIARAREGQGAATTHMVAGASKDALAWAASGGAHYRVATLTREQLWALVEGSEAVAASRMAAAEALLESSDESERARLRVAADRCAEPDAREALREMAESKGGHLNATRAG